MKLPVQKLLDMLPFLVHWLCYCLLCGCLSWRQHPTPFRARVLVWWLCECSRLQPAKHFPYQLGLEVVLPEVCCNLGAYTCQYWDTQETHKDIMQPAR